MKYGALFTILSTFLAAYGILGMNPQFADGQTGVILVAHGSPTHTGTRPWLTLSSGSRDT